jgi:hypothetical protein
MFINMQEFNYFYQLLMLWNNKKIIVLRTFNLNKLKYISIIIIGSKKSQDAVDKLLDSFAKSYQISGDQFIDIVVSLQ